MNNKRSNATYNEGNDVVNGDKGKLYKFQFKRKKKDFDIIEINFHHKMTIIIMIFNDFP